MTLMAQITEQLSFWEKYGPLGLLAGILFFLLLILLKGHKEAVNSLLAEMKADREMFRSELKFQREQCATDHQAQMATMMQHHERNIEWLTRLERAMRREPKPQS